MRKSNAPSRSVLTSSKAFVPEKVLSSSQCVSLAQIDTGSETSVRSTASILNLLVKPKHDFEEFDDVNEEIYNSKPVLVESTSTRNTAAFENKAATINKCTHPTNSNKRYFNVLYGKQSKKKHKTWEGDGVLEVGEKSLVLKDSEGKVLGQGMGKKNAELEEGSRLFVGSKEVEIIDIAPIPDETSKKRNSEEISNEEIAQFNKPAKKSKLAPMPLVKKRFEQVTMDFKPLTMPRPDHEHQWKYNSTGASVMDVNVDPKLAKVLREHQRQGVLFLYRCVMGYQDMTNIGCILADEMGLGKTLQCITLVWTLLRQGPYGGVPLLSRVLIVTPSSLTNNWKQEFMRWLGNEKIRTFVVDQKNKPNDYVRLKNIPVMIISYEMFVRCCDDIANISFDLLICDEGHRLKNNSIRTSMLLNQLPTKRRIILTGTPVQNDLQEFYALVDFVNPGFLGTYSEFRKKYEENIIASQQPGADEDTIKEGELQAQLLMKKTGGFILRRTQELLDKYLPTKHETVVFCKPSNLQTELFHSTISYWERRTNRKENENTMMEGTGDVSHLSVITMLKKIANHPILVYDAEDVQEDCLVGFLSSELERLNAETPLIEDATKLAVVASLLHALANTREKIVLASYFTQTLDLLGALCDQYGYKHCRLDGTTPSAQRIEIVNKFNSKYSNCYVFLLSARAGGTGLNLTGASRLVLFDSDWNPASDLQTMARIWRDGQKKSVFIYRLLTTGSIEEKIFQRQLSKAGLNEAIVDSRNTSSVKLSEEELKDLFSLNEENVSLTHKMLPCSCEGLGDIPQPLNTSNLHEDEIRDCQLLLGQNQKSMTSLRMNQLFQWEHHAHPFRPELLKEMGLEKTADHISFIFHNISVSNLKSDVMKTFK